MLLNRVRSTEVLLRPIDRTVLQAHSNTNSLFMRSAKYKTSTRVAVRPGSCGSETFCRAIFGRLVSLFRLSISDASWMHSLSACPAGDESGVDCIDCLARCRVPKQLINVQRRLHTLSREPTCILRPMCHFSL